MPLHDYRCNKCGDEVEIFCRVADLALPRVCRCGNVYERIFKVFPMAFVEPNICYDSPIDGRPITSKQARIEDLKRNGCRPYDPSEKDELIRRRKQEDQAFEKQLDETVEREVALMPARKRELLEQEVRSGATVEITRKDGTR